MQKKGKKRGENACGKGYGVYICTPNDNDGTGRKALKHANGDLRTDQETM